MNVRALVIFLLLSTPALAQGFAGLGTTAEGFSVPRPDVGLRFPQDHGAHYDYRIEWWYLTANLRGEDGADYGVQWTLFRSALAPRTGEGWSSPQLWMGNAALTTKTDHFVAERLARGGIGQAGVSTSPFRAWIDDWQTVSESPPGRDEIAKARLQASGKDFSFDLSVEARFPPVPQGERGYSVKSAHGQASYYYSQPFYDVAGTLRLPRGAVRVTGQAWFDHEWSSQPLAEDQTGWDWFSLHFDSGEKLMGFRLRDSGEGYSSATWINADGSVEPLTPNTLKLTPVETARIANREIPVVWRVDLKAKNLAIETRPLNRQSWMATRFPYWEGPVRIVGSHPGKGYVEMTGYE